MTEILFYHLERRSLDDVLPGLIEKTLDRGWRALIRADSAERADAIDTRLWTYDDQSFLPHAQSGDGDPARQPVLVTVEEGNPNAANVLFLVGGAAPPAWDSPAAQDLTRIVLMFDGRDPAAVETARAAWKDAKAAGHDVTYWKESPIGKWEKQG
jgi:DNA polymerase-3 subunit chi